MENDMFENAYNTLKKYDMLKKNDIIVVGISGGADSVSLFHFLCSIKEEYSLKIIGVHIHHGIRGADADEDAQYVRKLCCEYGAECEVYRFDIHSEAKKMKLTDEEAGRKIRYEAFDKVLKKYQANKIAVAHNMNDQAETLLMRICRGTGLKGLTGIAPVRGNIIRPLIECSRESIEQYCKSNNLQYQKDYTNDMDIYTRNKIRLKLIPLIKETLNPSIVSVLSRMRNILYEDEEYIEIQAKEAYKACLIKSSTERVCLDIKKIQGYHKVIQQRIVRFALQNFKADLHDIEFSHVKDILELMSKSTGKSISLTEGIEVCKEYNNLEFYTKSAPKDTKFFYNLIIEGETEVPQANITVKTKLYDKNFNKEILNNVYTKLFDYDKIKDNLKIRTRCIGDKIYLKGVGTKKLKDFFIDIKLPRQQRDEIPLIVTDTEVVWIVGYKINSRFEVSKETKKILCIQVVTNENNICKK